MTKRVMRRTAAIATAMLLPGLALTSASGVATAADSHQAAAQTYSLSFSPNQPKDSAGATFKLAFQQQPTTVTLQLPTGAALNAAAAPLCASPPTCEPDTQVGTGTATVVYQQYTIPLNFSIFNRAGGVAIVITLPNASPVVVLPTWSGSTLSITLPQGYYKGAPIILNQLTLTFDQIGHGGGAYIRTPATCPKGGWDSLGTFAYASTSAQLTAAAKCSLTKPKAKKKKKKKKKK